MNFYIAVQLRIYCVYDPISQHPLHISYKSECSNVTAVGAVISCICGFVSGHLSPQASLRSECKCAQYWHELHLCMFMVCNIAHRERKENVLMSRRERESSHSKDKRQMRKSEKNEMQEPGNDQTNTCQIKSVG